MHTFKTSLIQRRNFLKAGFLCSAVVIMDGCSVFGFTTSKNTLKTLQNDLFPKAKELGIDTSSYLQNVVLHHSRIAQEDKEFLKNGVKWLNESAVDMFEKNYTKLSASSRQEVLRAISKTRWGEIWIYNMMTYIFEALLGDPIYGANRDEAGWKWLAFSGGKPRATRAFL
jgi:hypothetical protein